MKLVVGRLLLLGAGLALLTACEVKRPKGVLTEAKMEEVLYDYHLAKVMADEVPYNEAYRRPIYRDGVFVKHGITEAEFDSSMVWYTRHTDQLAKMYEHITQRFKQANDAVNHLIALRDMPALEMPSGDSVEVWALHRHEVLTPFPLSSRIHFELTADTTFHERDSLCFLLDYRYHGQRTDSLQKAVMGLTLHFKNDSVLHAWQRLQAVGPARMELALQSDTLGALRNVSGFVYLPNDEQSASLRLLSARVMRYHAKDSLKLDSDTIQEAKPAAPKASDSPQDSLEVQPAKPASDQPAMRATDRLRQRHNKPDKPASTPSAKPEQRPLPTAKPPVKRSPAAKKRALGGKPLRPITLDEQELPQR